MKSKSHNLDKKGIISHAMLVTSIP
uniref:Uncharacterized protein n=1 Tax=Rhizophora mucronata TaxID=61149 RepID=A0A2P2R265_RHIMU